MKTFEQLGIKVKGTSGQQKTLCPNCSSQRKKDTEPCLSVNLDTGQYNCHNCGFAGGVKERTQIKETYAKRAYTKPKYEMADWKLEKEVVAWFKERGISKTTLEMNNIGSGFVKWLPRDKEEKLVISFPFLKNEQVVNVKYRTLDKEFRASKNAEQCFYGIQNLFEDGYLATEKVYITEGEIDALSLFECGFRYALSVPSGAAVGEDTNIEPKLEFLEDPDIQTVLESVKEVILVTDTDIKGKLLRDALARRIGFDKCFYVEFTSGCKDANEVLAQHGKEELISCLVNTKPMLKGAVEVTDLDAELVAFYNNGMKEGLHCGIEGVDEIFTLQENLLTLVTGTPESYKSVALDNITHGYADLHDMHVAVFSPETKPTEFHVGRLASIHSGFSMDKENANFMPFDVFQDACNWVGKHYTFLQPSVPTLKEILALAKVSILKHGTKILVIDPYSRVQSEGDIEADFIKKLLNTLSEFAVRYKVHVFVVAHPVKMEAPKPPANAPNTLTNYPLVTPYHISGSAHWFNSSDFILSIWKDRAVPTNPLKLWCLKSKYHHIAKSGQFCELNYDFDNWQLFSA